MKITFELDKEKDKQTIEFIESLTDYEKNNIIDSLKWDLIDRISNTIKRMEIRRKQRDCKHEYEEINRTGYDQDGDRFFDDDGEYMTVESVTTRCKKCGLTTSNMAYSNPRW